MTMGIKPIQPSESWLDQNIGFIIKIIIFVILLVIILLSTGYMKKIMVFINPDLENCKDGTCKTSCIKGDELQQQGIKCADTSKICCKPNNYIQSPECNGRAQGSPCGEVMLCNEYSVCISRCEYCSMYPEDKSCKITNMVGKSVKQLDATFSCGCTDMDCISLDNSKMGTCISEFCPSNNPIATDYMCCSTPYKD